MKRHATFLKNIAALLMLVALIAMLLPFVRITTSGGTATISGMEVLKIGARTGYEYISKGTIENDYVIQDGVTWGDVKSGATDAMEYVQLWKVAAGVAIVSLPLIFCFLAMLCTFIAEGKKTMVFPTLLLVLAVLENLILIAGVFRLQKLFTGGFAITLLLGIYAFTLLCGVALAILILLWITGGFIRPKERDKSRQDNNNDKKKKERTSWRDRRNKKRKKGSKKKKSKKRTKRSKRGKRDSSGRDDTSNQNQNQNLDNTQQKQAQPSGQAASFTGCATGNVTGLSGIYQGVDINRFYDGNHTFTIGTTPEAMHAIASGALSEIDKLAGANCVISYDITLKQYTVTSHSMTDIILQTENREFVRVANGMTKVVGANTLLLAGDVNNCIRLE